MPLPAAREGESVGFQIYPRSIVQGTLGDPEAVVWASIKQLCAHNIVHGVLADEDRYNIKSRRLRDAIARNVDIYVRHVAEFYDAAKAAKANTAPLLYYYSFLNLAKARCEIHRPRFHKLNECYRHGLAWRPNPSRLVNMHTECVSVTTRGVWHALWEALVGKPCPAPNPLNLKVASLFSFCFDTSVEYSRTFGRELNLLRESAFWVLIDGFMNQSRLWLLELWEWEFYKIESLLRTLR